MKKKLVYLSLFTLFLCGCNGTPVVIPNNNNGGNTNNNQEANNTSIAFSVKQYDYQNYIQWTNFDDIGFWVSSFVFEDESDTVSDYLGANSLKTKYISSGSEYDSFKEKISTLDSEGKIVDSYLEDFPKVDFDKYKIGLTAVCYDNYRYDFSMKNMTVNSTTIKQYIECERYNGFNMDYMSVGLVYLILPKSNSLNIETEMNITNHNSEIVEKKPIVYFYPEEEMDLTIKFPDEERLLTTYPKYNDGWNIHLNKDGTFTTGDSDREYYAIYFDAISNYECKFDEGFYVTKDNAISFLEEKMDYIGFNNHEVNEFMMYWLPILENNERSLVYFEQTEERNEESPLEFSTNPDTLIRTIIHIKKVDEEVNIPEQQLVHYERNGFVVTEWGGAEY